MRADLRPPRKTFVKWVGRGAQAVVVTMGAYLLLNWDLRTTTDLAITAAFLVVASLCNAYVKY